MRGRRKKRPAGKPGPGCKWVVCRTCEGTGEILGRWAQTLGGMRTRCPTCFRLGWIERQIDEPIDPEQAVGESQPGDDRTSEDLNSPQDQEPEPVEADVEAVNPSSDSSERTPHGEPSNLHEGNGGHTSPPDPLDPDGGIYHYAEPYSRSTLCGLPRNLRDSRWRREHGASSTVLEVGSSTPAGGRLCEYCSVAFVRSQRQQWGEGSGRRGTGRIAGGGSGKIIAGILGLLAAVSAVILLVFFLGIGREDQPDELVAVGETRTVTPRPSVSLSPTPPPTREPTVLPAPDSATFTPTPTIMPTLTPVAVATSTPTATPTSTVTPIPSATPTPTPTPTPIPTPTATPTPSPTPTATPTPIPRPDLRHLDAKLFMLELINAERVRAGLDPVSLGDNVAAQLHAEAALENCFLSHWGVDGLKPYMRYTLAGGYQSNGENASGLSYCIKPSDGYRRNAGTRQEIREVMRGLMASPGHRDNILDRWHKKVNVGLAWDSYNFSLIQHFEGDYVEYERQPVIENGVLTLSGMTKNGVIFRDVDDLGVQIFYDPPPYELSIGQLSRTGCYDQGLEIASLRPPLPEGWYYPEDEYFGGGLDCPDPYAVSVDAPAPESADEAHLISSRTQLLLMPITSNWAVWITAQEMSAQRDRFSVRAHVGDLVDRHGSGIYTITVWGSRDGESLIISQYSIFHGIVPPETYNGSAWDESR